VYYPSLYENAECIGTCVMAFPFSGRLRCNQHSQGDDKRELGSPVRHSVTHPNLLGPGRVQESGPEFDWLPSIDTFIIVMEYQSNLKSLKLLFINSSYDKLSSYLLIYYSLDINAILLIHFTYIYFTTLLHLYCTVYI